MTTEVLLPKIGFSMTEGVLAEWLAEDGAVVEAGQPLLSIESDKSINDVESPASGKLKILKQKGETCQVGAVLAIIE